jgi:sugar transferase (PEP-CTERM/EpsH1 system associated)
VGFIGSIISSKGVHIFLKAASEMIKTSPGVQFVVVGDLETDPHYSRKVREFAKLTNLEPKVKFVGFQDDIPQILSLLDIVVVPSRRPDPWPNVVIEAMAKAKPVVASATGGILESVRDGETGFLFPPGDWESLHKILLSLLQDEKLRRRIGATAQKHISEKFSASIMAEKIQKIYDGLLGYNDGQVAIIAKPLEGIDEAEIKENRRHAQGIWMSDKMLYAEYSSFCAQTYLEIEKMRKKNVLILTPELPYPLDRGGNIRIFNHIKMLSQKYNIYLLSFIQQESENQYIPVLQEFCKKISTVVFPRQLQAKPSGYRFLPKTIRGCYSEELKSHLLKIISDEKIDLVQIDTIFMSFYVTYLSSNIPAIFIEYDIDALSFRKSYLWNIRNAGFWSRLIELEKLSRFERYICKRFHRVITVSERDKKKLENLTGISNSTVVPNGVDTDFFYPYPDKTPGISNDIIFVGYMGHYPNEDGILYFYNQIFPFVRREWPDIKLYVVGSSTRRIFELKTDKNVIVTGFVKDVRQYLRKCAVFVVPLRLGGGIRSKILEAMAMGMPVISTSTGCNGIQVTPGENIIVADGAREFARQTIRLLKDKNLQEKLAKNGRALVEEKYGWQETIAQLDTVYADTINKFKNGSENLINEQR